LYNDVVILKDKIEEVDTAMRQAFQQHRFTSIIAYQSLLRYLNERYKNLVLGAYDIQYVDTEDGLATELLCPFHSDYLPPTTSGYGCSVEVLQQLDRQSQAINSEIEGLSEFDQSQRSFLEGASYMDDLYIEIMRATGRPVPPNLSRDFLWHLGADAQHRTRLGCMTQDGTSYQPVNPATTVIPWPEGAAKVALRGPFSTEKNEPGIAQRVLEQLVLWGRQREQADYLKLPAEYPANTQARRDAEQREQGISSLLFSGRNTLRTTKRLNIEQMQDSLQPILQFSDAQKQVREMLQPLREVMQEFSLMAAARHRGMRAFTARFASLVRRSCLFRPCNALLDRALKIDLEDSCFPYTSGMFLSNPQHYETCREQAEVDEVL
jgi:hypothetical protein